MITSFLFDISGVLYDGNRPVVGAVDAINRLQNKALPIRFVTNSSRLTDKMILSKLRAMGFLIDSSQLFTAIGAIKQTLVHRQLRPYCLVHPVLDPEFMPFDHGNPNAVVVTDAAERFNFNHMNQAFSLLLDGSPLLGIGRNRYFKHDNKLCLDAGPFICALEYAAGIKADILGKPASAFFMAAIKSLDCRPQDIVMIGDDVEADIEGALNVGLQACLVKTGKYRSGDETRLRGSKAEILPSVVEAIDRYS